MDWLQRAEDAGCCARHQPHFLCSAKESKQTNLETAAAPLERPCGLPAFAHARRAVAKTRFAQTVGNRLPPACTCKHGAPEGGFAGSAAPSCPQLTKGNNARRNATCLPTMAKPSKSKPILQRQACASAAGDFGQKLSERSEFLLAARCACASLGSPKGRCSWAAFLCLLSLAEQRK